MPDNQVRIPLEDMKSTLSEILRRYHFNQQNADLISRITAESSLDGVYSHGINRFPRFIESIMKGFVKVDKRSVLFRKSGNIEQWDGQLGPGILNAWICMNRAIEISEKGAIGCVALQNTNHWMRGGTYGWQAAEAGYIGICFTNTMPNMVPWGGIEPGIGNNPFIIAIPRSEGHIVLDMAMSQYSFGKMEEYRMNNEDLPFPGGFDEHGELTTRPDTIINNGKALPIGYWKGSALSVMLDILAATLSGGETTSRISGREEEYGLSQVFLAIDPGILSEVQRNRIMNEIISFTKNVKAIKPGEKIYYPGERTMITRKKNLQNGIPVNRKIWEQILQL